MTVENNLPTFAGFCSKPDCSCRKPSLLPCSDWEACPDTSGAIRCGCCGWPLENHPKEVIIKEYRLLQKDYEAVVDRLANL